MRTARVLTVSPSMLWAREVPGSGGGVPGPGGGVVWWEVLSQHALRQTPLVNRMTNRCKNITLPQTSFAVGKNNVIVALNCIVLVKIIWKLSSYQPGYFRFQIVFSR